MARAAASYRGARRNMALRVNKDTWFGIAPTGVKFESPKGKRYPYASKRQIERQQRQHTKGLTV